MDHFKTLKKISGFLIGLGIFSSVIGLIVFFMGIYVMNSDENSSIAKAFAARGYGDVEDIKLMGLTVCIIAISILIGALFNIARGIIGFRVINGSCFIAAMVLGILCLIGDGLALVLSILNNSNIIIKGLYFALSILYIYCARGVKNENEEHEMLLAATSINRNKVSTDEEAAKFFG